jgi:hypothetical protein
MSRLGRVVPMLLVAFALSGCTALTTAKNPPPPRASGVVAAVEAGSDVGNNRPHVTYDGLMVRRRVVIAIHPTAAADLIFLRSKMDDAAARLHMTLTTVSTSVLDPALLEHLAPELAVAIPAGKTPADARRLIDPASVEGRRLREVAKYDVASVLVHDLRFSAPSANPVGVANDIDREGILSDALGSYTTTIGRRELDITYTGPLLSDDLVQSVRVGIARGAGIQPAAVTVAPRSITGVGVDMAKEPTPAPVAINIATSHNHSAALPIAPVAEAASWYSSSWVVWVLAPAVLMIFTLVLLMITPGGRAMLRRKQGAGSSSVPGLSPEHVVD